MGEVVWWEVDTALPEVFQRFHGKLWGWSFSRAFEDTELTTDYWVIQHEGKDIGGMQRAASDADSRGMRVYVRVSDLEATLTRVLALGGTIETPRVNLDGSQWFANFRDPTGVSFGVWTSSAPGA